MLGPGVVVAAFLPAPTFAVWCLAFLSAKPAWHKADDAAGGRMENDMNAMLGTPLGVGLTLGSVLSDFAFASCFVW